MKTYKILRPIVVGSHIYESGVVDLELDLPVEEKLLRLGCIILAGETIEPDPSIEAPPMDVISHGAPIGGKGKSKGRGRGRSRTK